MKNKKNIGTLEKVIIWILVILDSLILIGMFLATWFFGHA